jgi:indole-3-glycerol phosphate synthase
VSRLSQAISEGDGISVIPLLEGDISRLATIAEAAGAEAVAVPALADVARARPHTALPILVREPVLEAGRADACVLVFEDVAEDGEELEELHARVLDAGLDCVVDVRDEEELEQALERIDPEIILISERDRDRDEEELERTLDLLPDVPAGKLVISEGALAAREQIVALERAGVDAVLVLAREGDFESTVAELTGRALR